METIVTHKHYRLILFLSTFVIVVLGALLSRVGLLMLFPSTLGNDYGSLISTIEWMDQVILSRVAGVYAVLSLFIAIAVIYLHLFYSHRIAGPAYRLGREAVLLGSGNLRGNIRFRLKDNLTDMADELSRTASEYQKRVQTMRDILARIEAHSVTLSGLVERRDGPADMEHALEQVNGDLKKLNSVLAEIRT